MINNSGSNSGQKAVIWSPVSFVDVIYFDMLKILNPTLDYYQHSNTVYSDSFALPNFCEFHKFLLVVKVYFMKFWDVFNLCVYT